MEQRYKLVQRNVEETATLVKSYLEGVSGVQQTKHGARKSSPLGGGKTTSTDFKQGFGSTLNIPFRTGQNIESSSEQVGIRGGDVGRSVSFLQNKSMALNDPPSSNQLSGTSQFAVQQGMQIVEYLQGL